MPCFPGWGKGPPRRPAQGTRPPDPPASTDISSESNTKWAAPSPLPSHDVTSYMLSLSPSLDVSNHKSPNPNQALLRQSQQTTPLLNPNPNPSPLISPSLSPMYPNSPVYFDMNLTLSPQPQPFNVMNDPNLSLIPHPYPNHKPKP